MLVRLALIGSGAWIAADAVNQWYLGQWQGAPLPVPEAAAPAVPAPSKGPASYVGVVRRNVFNSGPQSVAPAPVAVGPSTAPVPVIEPLNLNARLTGTVVGATQDQSYAMILDVAKRDEGLYTVGDRIMDTAVVTSIKRDEVRLVRGKAEQVLRLFDEKKDRGTVTVSSARPTPTEPDGGLLVLDRAEVDDALGNIPKLLTQARLLPNFRAGVTDGFRIFNIVPGSLFSKIGLRNGDVLHRINEIEIKDPTKFMGLFADLKNQSSITLDLVRGNERKTFEYEIR